MCRSCRCILFPGWLPVVTSAPILGSYSYSHLPAARCQCFLFCRRENFFFLFFFLRQANGEKPGVHCSSFRFISGVKVLQRVFLHTSITLALTLRHSGPCKTCAICPSKRRSMSVSLPKPPPDSPTLNSPIQFPGWAFVLSKLGPICGVTEPPDGESLAALFWRTHTHTHPEENLSLMSSGSPDRARDLRWDEWFHLEGRKENVACDAKMKKSKVETVTVKMWKVNEIEKSMENDQRCCRWNGSLSWMGRLEGWKQQLDFCWLKPLSISVEKLRSDWGCRVVFSSLPERILRIKLRVTKASQSHFNAACLVWTTAGRISASFARNLRVRRDVDTQRWGGFSSGRKWHDGWSRAEWDWSLFPVGPPSCSTASQVELVHCRRRRWTLEFGFTALGVCSLVFHCDSLHCRNLYDILCIQDSYFNAQKQLPCWTEIENDGSYPSEMFLIGSPTASRQYGK